MSKQIILDGLASLDLTIVTRANAEALLGYIVEAELYFRKYPTDSIFLKNWRNQHLLGALSAIVLKRLHLARTQIALSLCEDDQFIHDPKHVSDKLDTIIESDINGWLAKLKRAEIDSLLKDY